PEPRSSRRHEALIHFRFWLLAFGFGSQSLVTSAATVHGLNTRMHLVRATHGPPHGLVFRTALTPLSLGNQRWEALEVTSGMSENVDPAPPPPPAPTPHQVWARATFWTAVVA